MRLARTLLSVLVYGALGLLALAGVAVSALALYASLRGGGRVVAAKLIRYADDAVAGRLELAGIEVLPRGGVEIRGFKAYDPDGHLVLDVDRAFVSVDVTRLRNKVVGISAELEGASVLVEEEEGGLSLLRAFAPAHPSPPQPKKQDADLLGMGGWTLRLLRLTARGVDVWWQDRAGGTRLEAHDLSLDARAVAAPHRVRAELKLAGELVAPLEAPVSLEVRGLLDGDRARVPVVRARLGGTELAGLGEVDVRTLVGRFALLRAEVDRREARALVGQTPPGADLALHAYAESSGAQATAAVHVEPRQRPDQRAPILAEAGDAAVAVPLGGARALGFDVAVRALDPSKLHAEAPPGQITLAAHGGVAGTRLADLRGVLALDLAPSRLRGGLLGPAQASARVDRGSWDVSRLSLQAPGVRVEGAGRWQPGGTVAGRFSADSADLAAATRNLAALLGTPLPHLSGQVHVAVAATGTGAAPALTAELSAPEVRLDAVSVGGLRADVELRGPFRPGQLQVSAQADQVATGEVPVARALSLKASVGPDGTGPKPGARGRLSATAHLPRLGKEPVEVEATATLPPEQTSLRLEGLAIGYPGRRYELEAPATVIFEGPKVDRLALHAGPERILLEGGIRKREVDAHLALERLDLSGLPAGLLPADEGIAGELSADVRATGPASGPLVAGHVALAGGAFRELRGLSAEGDVRWDLAARRVGAKLSVAEHAQPRVALEADLPLPFAGRPGEPVSATAQVQGLSAEELLGLVRVDVPARGRLSATARLQGTAGAPALHLEANASDAAYDDLDGLSVTATADVARTATLRVEVGLAKSPAVRLGAEVPLDLAELAARPGPTARALREARLAGTVEVPGLDLAALSGRLGVPDELSGRLSGTAKVSGRVNAPRATGSFAVDGGGFQGYVGVAARLEAEARDDGVSARGTVRLGGQEAIAFEVALRRPVERLITLAGLEAAPLAAQLTIPSQELSQATTGAPLAVAGTLEGRAKAQGTLGHPVLEADLTGRGVSIEGRPLGDVRAAARAGGEALSVELSLAPPAGGKLEASLAVTVPVSIELTGEQLAKAPAKAALRAQALDLGFLTAALPTTVRAASGKLEADVTAKGPLSHLVPRGAVRLEGGRVAVSEYGDWSGIGLDVEVTDDAVVVRRLDATRGKGKLHVEAALRGLTASQAKLEGRLTTQDLTIVRAGMDVVTLTNLDVKVGGGYQDQTLEVRFDVAPTTLRLPDKLPRELQSLERRQDIVVGKKKPRKASAASAAPAGKGFALKAHLVVPGRLRVVESNPRVDLELRADVTYERSGGAEYVSGSVQVVRGDVAPISGRRFDVQRGRITFSGGPLQAAVVDAEATYDNPTARVTVNISGPLTHPVIKMTSVPPLDESQIAMLIATGGTDLKAGGGGANVSGLQDASKIGFAVFNTLIRDRLPIDTSLTFDATANMTRVGYFVPGTSIYVGYIHRSDARPEENENSDEIHIQYAITPRWSLEARWGNASTGGATLLWSKDY